MPEKKVAVALSGGVDSAVAALLLKEAGYEVVGITMRLWHENESHPDTNHCFSYAAQDIHNAELICHLLDIPFHIVNFEDVFKKHVVDYLCREYTKGQTPNPCIACNQHIKFGYLLDKALSLGADYLATGHYVRTCHSETGYHLLKGIDPDKDQSYVLYTLEQEKLSRLLFPLGKYIKTEVQVLAKENELSDIVKPSSYDICFVAGHYSTFLGHSLIEGDIIDSQGRALGRHRGAACYTIGQRRGLGLATGERLYVTKIEPDRNRIIVGNERELYSKKLIARNVKWVSGESPLAPIEIMAKVRYRSPGTAAVLVPGSSSVEIQFCQPQRAITPGQSVVFYQDNQVLGGGIIEN